METELDNSENEKLIKKRFLGCPFVTTNIGEEFFYLSFFVMSECCYKDIISFEFKSYKDLEKAKNDINEELKQMYDSEIRNFLEQKSSPITPLTMQETKLDDKFRRRFDNKIWETIEDYLSLHPELKKQ